MSERELIKILNLSRLEVERYTVALATLAETFQLHNEVHEPTVYLIWDSIPFRAIKRLEDKLNWIKNFTV